MADDELPEGTEETPHAVPTEEATEIAGSAEDAALEAAAGAGARALRVAGQGLALSLGRVPNVGTIGPACGRRITGSNNAARRTTIAAARDRSSAKNF